jgi:hypothetical protein
MVRGRAAAAEAAYLLDVDELRRFDGLEGGHCVAAGEVS